MSHRNIKHLTPSEYYQIILYGDFTILENSLQNEEFFEQGRILIMYLVTHRGSGYITMGNIVEKKGLDNFKQIYGPELEEYLMRFSAGSMTISHGYIPDLAFEKLFSEEFRYRDNENKVPSLEDIEQLFVAFSPDSTPESRAAHIRQLFYYGNIATLQFALRVFACANEVENILNYSKKYPDDLRISLKYNRLADLPPHVIN